MACQKNVKKNAKIDVRKECENKLNRCQEATKKNVSIYARKYVRIDAR